MKFLLSVFVASLVMNTAMAEKVETPSSLAGAKLVTAQEVKAAQAGGAVVVDTRKKLEYVEKHIKGAINVPYKEKSAKVADFDMSQDKWKMDKLPKDKNTKIVFYCNGPTCWKSFKASKMAIKEGFKNVLWFRTGMPSWNAAGFPVE